MSVARVYKTCTPPGPIPSAMRVVQLRLLRFVLHRQIFDGVRNTRSCGCSSSTCIVKTAVETKHFEAEHRSAVAMAPTSENRDLTSPAIC